MTDPFVFETTSPRFALPLLYAGQAQKEVFVNEAHALTDALMHCAVEGELSAPPATPVDGENWLVGAAASGDWTSQEGNLACRQSGNWLFIAPRDGMRLLDRTTGQERRFFGNWQIATTTAEPFGGSTVDLEARTAISSLIEALRASGVFPST